MTVFGIQAFAAVLETFHYTNKNILRDESQPKSTNEWIEGDQAELCSGTLDTMLTSPDFIRECERNHVFSLAPGKGTKPISIFKDKHCEELA